MAAIGVPVVLYLAYVRLIAHQPIAERTPLLLFGFFLIFGGLQLLMTGLLGEMLSRTYHESQNKATYVIREIRQSSEVVLDDEGDRLQPLV